MKRTFRVVPNWLYLTIVAWASAWLAYALLLTRSRGLSLVTVTIALVFAWNINVLYVRVARPTVKRIIGVIRKHQGNKRTDKILQNIRRNNAKIKIRDTDETLSH